MDRNALYLASACDSIFMPVTGNFMFVGFGSGAMYVKNTLDKLGIKVDLHRIADSFVKALAGYLHSRVEYPEEQTLPEIKEKFEGTDTKVGSKARHKSRADSRSH